MQICLLKDTTSLLTIINLQTTLLRSAREAEESIKKAKQKGETLPSEARFDSNCITPGMCVLI